MKDSSKAGSTHVRFAIHLMFQLAGGGAAAAAMFVLLVLCTYCLLCIVGMHDVNLTAAAVFGRFTYK